MKNKIGILSLICFMLTAIVACNKKGSSIIDNPTGINIVSKDETTIAGFDAFMSTDETVVITADVINGKKSTDYGLYWSSNPASLFTFVETEDKNSVQVKALAEGDGTITATLFSKDGTNDIVSNVLKFRVENTHKTNANFQKGKTTYKEGNEEKPLNIGTLYRKGGIPRMNSIGGAHILVVPFGFQEEEYKRKQTKEKIDLIKKVFTGTTEELEAVGGWESLKSFYKKSSYGLSDFDCYVPDNWCIWDKSCNLLPQQNERDEYAGIKAAEFARTWYNTEYSKPNHGDLGQDAPSIDWFDSDKDGFIDMVWSVYSHETIDVASDWWAYVIQTGNQAGTTSFPTVQTCAWAGLDTTDRYDCGYNAHTFIHETGHTYGLLDYYDYNNAWSPMGGIDFMDHNMGDHNMYSKFILGWTSPYVVDDTALITLRPGTSTGDCFIIPSPGYNGTAFDEYMMVELMAPVGLCEHDYIGGYSGLNGYSKPGVRILHVDARVYEGDRNTYAKTINEVANSYGRMRVNNSYGGRDSLYKDGDYFPVLDKDGKEISQRYYTEVSLMESSFTDTNNWTVAGHNASNASLFGAGYSFNLSKKKGWAKMFMPSQSNLWNKAKTITGWSKDKKKQTYTIDETCTFNYDIKVLSIDPDEQYGYTARILVTKDAAVYN